METCGVSKKLTWSASSILRLGIDVEQARQGEQRGFERGAGDDHALLFVLQLDVGAEGIDAGAGAVLLQVGGLIVERLGQIGARLRGVHVGRGALAAEVLRDHQQDAFFAHAEFLRAAGILMPSGMER
jgi:hypothetical protein